MSSTPRHIVVAINPTAAFGKNSVAGELTISTLEAAGFRVTALRAESFDLLRGQLNRALTLTPDALVVVGGDGMVSLAVNMLAQTSVPFAVVPAGTGNDLARGIGLPVGDLTRCISLMVASLEREPERLDLGRITSVDGSEVRWFASILSAGFDAIVNERANAMKWPKGKSRYTLALLLELFALKPVKYSLTVDGVTREESAMLISVANNSTMGGGMRVTPEASMRDGLLDVFVLRPLSRLRFLRLFPRVFAGTHVTEPEVLIERGKTVVLDAPGIVAYADGERVWALPVHVDVVPAAVRVFI
ncbi:diacylglycerol kinase (ATP) [Aurantimicrobium minutum]|uniref:diacylglycerol kinase family protein n=1 Tax=Aurantimicrobium minutum TaxID=708131 RepID=UPI0024062D9B|nr:diacylglycerol kinase family protein [Aurantimicrobium minutum]MDF9809191.1 diacylglycerol kinase (ATP) [Aurantimicrobium minutum]